MTVRAMACLGSIVMAFGCSRPEPAATAALGAGPPCIVHATSAPADSLLAACERARARFTELLGETAFPVTVLEHDTLDNVGDIRDGRIVFEVTSLGALAERNDPMATRSLPEFVMHELGHLLLFAYIDGAHPDSLDGYGSSLPDWVDEGVAMWMEPESLSRSRFENAGKLPDSALDVVALTARRHPNLRAGDGPPFLSVPLLLTAVECDSAICGPYPLGHQYVRIAHWIDLAGVLHVDTIFGGDPLWDWFSGIEFYTKVSTLLPFLHATGGVPLIHEVFARIRAGQAPARVFTALPSLPSDPADVNREWIRFVRSLVRTGADAVGGPAGARRRSGR